jgi:hypothetical protein
MKTINNSLEIKKKIREYKYTFISLKEDEPQRINIKSSELFENETRNNMVKWLSFLCDTLNFNIQTLLRSVNIFDKFISVSDLFENDDLTQEKMNLITVACLSLGTKLEEINCNYVKFFTDKVLNLPDCQIFSVKALSKMELKILKQLKYKTLYTTSYDFLLHYLDIFQYFYNPSSYFFENIKEYAVNLMKQNINTNLYLSMSQSDYAFFCLHQAFLQIGNNDIMKKLLNILIIFNNGFNSSDLKREERTENINNKIDKIKIFRNSKVNIFPLPSF